MAVKRKLPVAARKDRKKAHSEQNDQSTRRTSQRLKKRTSPQKPTTKNQEPTPPIVHKPPKSKPLPSKDAPSSGSIHKISLPNRINPDKPPIPIEHHISPLTHPSPNASSSPPSLIFTHGAGGTLSTPAMREFVGGYVRPSPSTSNSNSTSKPVPGMNADMVTFQGTMNLKSRISAFGTVVEEFWGKHQTGIKASKDHDDDDDDDEDDEKEERVLVVGGRSMGARAAVGFATAREKIDDKEERKVGGLVLVNFPLRSEKGITREEELLGIDARVNVLFVVGTRDGMCDLPELMRVIERMEARCWMIVCQGVDHGMAIKGKGATQGTREVRMHAGMVAREWVGRREQGAGTGDDQARFRSVEWDIENNRVIDNGWELEYRISSSAHGPADDGDEY